MMGALFGQEVLRERVSGIKHHLSVSGLSRFIYWASHLLAHSIFMMPCFAVVWIIMWLWDMDGATGNNVFAYILLMVCYTPICILFGYVLSRWVGWGCV